MAKLAPTTPNAADLKREDDTAVLVVQQRPKTYDDGRPRKLGAADDVFFANVAYYRTYSAAPQKIAAGDVAGASAWKRLRAVVNRELLAKVPVSNGWNPKSPTWPLPTPPKDWSAGSSFKARRPWRPTLPQTRYHCGTDLKAAAGLPIFAPEGGTIVARESGWEMVKDPKTGKLRGVKSLILTTDSGVTVLLGGTRPGSAKVSNGQRVEAGQQLAEVGSYPLGDTMLHVQLYGRHLTEKEVNARKKWDLGGDPPPDLLDPTEYLTAASTNPKLAQAMSLVSDVKSSEEEALVANDVEGGEVNEGTPDPEPDAGDDEPLAAAAGGRTGASPCVGDTCELADVEAWKAAMAEERANLVAVGRRMAKRGGINAVKEALNTTADADALLVQLSTSTDPADLQVSFLVSAVIGLRRIREGLEKALAAPKKKGSSSGMIIAAGAVVALATTVVVIAASRPKRRAA